jgi:tetratricopeptide (TPR) repeat protein
MNRIEILQSMVEQNPADSFSRYGLAMEFVNAGRLEDAEHHFMQLLEHNPNYVAGYFHGGQTLQKMNRADDARALYSRGIEVASAAGDDHAAAEMQGALDMLS